jgi:hypothetical protein
MVERTTYHHPLYNPSSFIAAGQATAFTTRFIAA